MHAQHVSDSIKRRAELFGYDVERHGFSHEPMQVCKVDVGRIGSEKGEIRSR
jgi:hypothetical protein